VYGLFETGVVAVAAGRRCPIDIPAPVFGLSPAMFALCGGPALARTCQTRRFAPTKATATRGGGGAAAAVYPQSLVLNFLTSFGYTFLRVRVSGVCTCRA